MKDGGCGFHVLKKLSTKDIAGYLVLHDAKELKDLHEQFVTKKVLFANYLEISLFNDYFGEQVGFIFSFRQHLTTSLTPLAVWGVLVYHSGVESHLGRDTPPI